MLWEPINVEVATRLAACKSCTELFIGKLSWRTIIYNYIVRAQFVDKAGIGWLPVYYEDHERRRYSGGTQTRVRRQKLDSF